MHDDNGYVIRGRDGFYVRRQWYAKTWQLVVGLLWAVCTSAVLVLLLATVDLMRGDHR